MAFIAVASAVAALTLPFIIDETSPKPQISNTSDLGLIDESIKLGCTELSINELKVISNLFDKDSDEDYWVNDIAFEDYSLQKDLEKCKAIVFSIIENNP